MKTKQPKSAALYARYSTDRQDSRSIDDQLRRCRRFAEEREFVVVDEFTDAAKSGASVHRADLQRLLAAVRQPIPPFTVVLVDDLSRLSRDLGDTWNIVFGQLAGAGVQVIDCTTGMASDGAGARLTFGAMALVNDTFLQLVKAETHRGLEGRALAGFHTGGRCYGYSSKPEPSPPDLEHPRYLVVIKLDEANIVQRIYEARANGASLSFIMRNLNSDGIPAPYDKLGYSKHATGKGWAINQVQYMLKNDRYTGRITWNKRKWYRDPVTKRRRFKERPESEWVVFDHAALCIVSPDLWKRVQETFRVPSEKRSRGRPPGSCSVVKHPHLMTGLLRCSVCGGSMTVLGSKKKGAKTYRQLCCATNHNKGPSACPNAKQVSMSRVEESVIEGVIDFVGSEKFRSWATEALYREEKKHEREQLPDPRELLERQLQAQQAKVDRVAEAVLEEGLSDALKTLLKREEGKLRDLRGRLATTAPPKRAQGTQPPLEVEKLLQTLRNIETIMDENPLAARQAVQRVVDSVLLNPNGADGEYQAEVTLKEERPVLSSAVPSFAGKLSCGDRI